MNRDADFAEKVRAALGAMDVAFAAGDGDAHTPSEGWRIALLMNSHARPIEEVT